MFDINLFHLAKWQIDKGKRSKKQKKKKLNESRPGVCEAATSVSRHKKKNEKKNERKYE